MRKDITTTTQEKKEVKEGLWFKCPKCKKIVPTEDHENNLSVCECGYHDRISSETYLSILFDGQKHTEINAGLKSGDPLKFEDTKKYPDRREAAIKKTKMNDAVRTAVGKIEGRTCVIGAMDFRFIGGSMGSVVGEKLARAIDYSLEHKAPLIIISKSGGARMQEAAYSLMQMAKTSARLALLDEAKVPYISLLTDPTSGGVTASFAMLGDVNIAEPGALIGFAGPRVIRDTIGRDLPEGFQSSEFVLEHGFLDFISERSKLKENIALQLRLFLD